MKIGGIQENEFVRALVKTADSSLEEYWFGLKWVSFISRFFWRDNSLMVYSNWVPDEPPSDKNSYPRAVALTKDLSHTSSREVSGSWSCRVCGRLGNIKTGFVSETLL